MRLLADEDFDNRILRAIRRETTTMDIIRVQDTEVYQAEDSAVLEWATQQQRIVLTHDIKTMSKFAYERIREGKPMLGVIAVHRNRSMRAIIDDILLIIGASEPEEFENQVFYVPI